MARYKTKKKQLARRHKRLRQKISGTASRPRLSVHISANNIYVQFIDDESGRTLAAASSLDGKFKEQKGKANVAGAELLGKMAGEKAIESGIKEAVFDRGGFQYHGRVKALADAARKTGLKF
jgi:large subunit ribosomal protein L18